MTSKQSVLKLSEDRIKHLEMLQQIITRMANNSFLLKGWTVTLVAAIIAVIDKSQLHTVGWVALIPVFIFWGLDGYFLRQEKLFRELYNHVRQPEKYDDATDFNLSTSIVQDKVSCVFFIMFSDTLITFYLSLLFAVSIAIAYV